MPRTRHELPREAKVEEIVELAEARLRAGGFRALSVADIARELGLAQGAIYWYFPSKDDLFVAALRRLLAGVLAAKPPHGAGIERQVVWWVDRLEELSVHRAAVRERAGVSPVVADFEHASYDAMERMLVRGLAGRVSPEDLGTVARTFIATCDGILLRGLSKDERDRLVLFALRRLAGEPADAGITPPAPR